MFTATKWVIFSLGYNVNSSGSFSVVLVMFGFGLEDCKLTDWRNCCARDAVINADGMDI